MKRNANTKFKTKKTPQQIAAALFTGGAPRREPTAQQDVKKGPKRRQSTAPRGP